MMRFRPIRPLVWLGLFFSALSADAQIVVTVSRYAGLPNFEHSRQTRWVQTEHGFQKVEHPPISSSFSCTTLLDVQQLFPLDQMVATGYLTPESAREYQKLGLKLQPEQVSFLEYADTSIPRRTKANQIANPLEAFFLQQDLETASSMWVIAGQVLNLKTSTIDQALLPWQLEPKLAEVSKRLDRKKYKFVSEWGRAAQTSPKEIDTLLSTAALMQLKEVIAVGGDPADAWVSFHSLGPIHTRAYRQRYPERIFFEDPATHEAIFLVPLTEVLEKSPPSGVSPFMKTLDHLGFSDVSAASLIQYFRQTELSELEWITRDRHQMTTEAPLVVYDVSDFHAELVRKRLAAGGITGEEAETIENVLNQLPIDDFLPNHPQEADYVFTPGTRDRLADRNAIYLTNIPGAVLSVDPEFVAKLVYSFLGTKYAELKALDPKYSVAEFRKFLVAKDIRFQIGSFEAKTIAAAEAVAKHATYHGQITGNTQTKTALELYDSIVKNGFDATYNPKKEFKAIEYRAADLFSTIDENPIAMAWFESPIVHLRHGLGAAKRTLYNPQVF